MIPRSDPSIVVDLQGAPIDLNHFSSKVWADLKLVGAKQPHKNEMLTQEKREHEAIEAKFAHPEAISIACRDRPTANRSVIDANGHVILPCAECKAELKEFPFAFENGDAVIPQSTTAAVHSLITKERLWISRSNHQRVATDSFVHPLIL